MTPTLLFSDLTSFWPPSPFVPDGHWWSPLYNHCCEVILPKVRSRGLGGRTSVNRVQYCAVPAVLGTDSYINSLSSCPITFPVGRKSSRQGTLMHSLVRIKNIRCKNLLFTFAKILFVSSKCPVSMEFMKCEHLVKRSRHSFLLKYRYAFLIINVL